MLDASCHDPVILKFPPRVYLRAINAFPIRLARVNRHRQHQGREQVCKSDDAEIWTASCQISVDKS